MLKTAACFNYYCGLEAGKTEKYSDMMSLYNLLHRPLTHYHKWIQRKGKSTLAKKEQLLNVRDECVVILQVRMSETFKR